jgi:histidinol-phosphate aminotransferase
MSDEQTYGAPKSYVAPTFRSASGEPPPLRLHLNENTGGCSPAVLAAIRAIEADEIACYPDYADITAAVERFLDVDAGWVQLTNGLDEGLHVVAQAAATRAGRSSRPRSAVIVEPAFEMYAICAAAAGLDVVRIPPRDGFVFPLDALLAEAALDAGLFYLTDPNNPTGLAIPPGAIEQLCAAAPDAIVLVDEAYVEFSGRTSLPSLPRFRNLVIGRTFAKAHGLAGLRAGALVAHAETLAPLRRVLPPFTLNVCAMRGLQAALQDPAFVAWSVSQARASKALIYEWCDGRGFTYWPSDANFALLRVGAAAPAIVSALAERGVLVRDRSDQPGCDGCIRITAGPIEHTRTCLAELEAVLASRPD